MEIQHFNWSFNKTMDGNSWQFRKLSLATDFPALL